MKNLSRKKIIVVSLIVLGLLLLVWFFGALSSEQRQDIGSSVRNLFPFGQVTDSPFSPGGGTQGTTDGETPGGQQTIEEPEPEITTPRLRKIVDFPVGGFVPLLKTEEVEVPDFVVDAEGNTIPTTRFVNVLNHYVRYTDIDNGTVYETQVTPVALSREVIIENFIPNAEYAYFSSDGNSIVYQYWNRNARTPETYLARVAPIPLVIEACPFDFSPIELGDDELRVIGIHEFLNRIPQTRVARSGPNSPGNETSLVTEGTLTAIKNFQSLYQLDIDGQLGSATRAKMTELCDEQQERISRQAWEALERKYTISGFFLPSGIIDLSISPSTSDMFYIQKDDQGVVGFLYDLIAETTQPIFQSPFTEWASHWNSTLSLELTTKPSYAVEGFSYRLNPETGRYFKSLPEKKGLVTLASPNNRKVLFSEATNNSFSLSIYDRETGITQPLGVQTLVDKCVWSYDSVYLFCGVPRNFAHGNQYPDIWYQGLERYQDGIWVMNALTSEERYLEDLVFEYGASIDIERIGIDPEGDYLYFIDKDTEHLWSYRLS